MLRYFFPGGLIMMRRFLIVAVCACGVPLALYANDDGRDLVRKSMALAQPQTAKFRYKMLVFRGEKVLEQHFDQYVKRNPNRENKMRITFTHPARLELLSHAHKNRDDDQWLKMSAGNVKRIVGTDLDKPFANSNLYFEDLKELNVDDYDFLHRGTVKAVGEECHKIEAIKKRGTVVYSKLVLYLRTYDQYIVRIDYYLKDEFHKYLERINIKPVGNYLTPYRIIMYRADGRGKTELKLAGNPEYDVPIADAFFITEKFR